MSSDRRNEIKGALAFSIVLTAMLWITLSSRETDRSFNAYWAPFQSYVKIFTGNKRLILENVGNILLFFPFGFLCKNYLSDKIKVVCSIGLLCSLFIEIMQYVGNIGCFETDDLLHNTIGTLGGFFLSKKVCLKPKRYRVKQLVAWVIVNTIILNIFVVSGKLYADYARVLKMHDCDSDYDVGNSPNLLILDGKDGFFWNSLVHAKYLNNGMVSVSGTTKIRTWYPIGELEVDVGQYELSVVSDKSLALIDIEVEKYLPQDGKYHEFIKNAGDNIIRFEIDDTTILKIYIGIYPGFSGKVAIRPVIFKEDR